MVKRHKLLLLIIAVAVICGNAGAYEMKGFADITFNKSTKLNPENKVGSFALGQYDLYVLQPVDEKINVLGEAVIETGADGEAGIDLERLQVGYDFNELLKVRAGRFHNILGYWNTAFHHGTQLQTSVARPGFIGFEDDGGIMPVHLVGLHISGRLNASPVSAEYGVMAGNGEVIKRDATGAAALNPGNVTDNDRNKPVSYNVTLFPSFIPNLGIGVSGSNGHMQGFTLAGALNEEVAQSILGGHAYYTGNALELLSEYYNFRNKNRLVAGTPHFTSKAYYVQGGYKIADTVTPYVRYELVDVKSAGGVSPDPYFKALGTVNSHRIVSGLRVDISIHSSLKAEIRSLDVKDAAGKSQEYAAQWAFSF